MYLGILLIGLGTILISFQWWVLGVFMLFLAVRYYTLIVKEEKLLEQAFGQEYLEYKARTPRLFPRVSAWLAKDAASYLPLRWPWLKRELSTLVILPLVIITLEVWKILVLQREPLFVSELLGFLIAGGIFLLFAFRLRKHYERIAA